MAETTTSGPYDESVDALAVSTPSGMEDESTEADADMTTRPMSPRMDDSEETTTSIIVEVPADASVPGIDSDSLVTETTPVSVTSIPLTTMRVISVEDEGDSVTVVTMRPSTEVTDMDIEGSG